MKTMLEIDTGDPSPTAKTVAGFVEKYRNNAKRRLDILRKKPESWGEGTGAFLM